MGFNSLIAEKRIAAAAWTEIFGDARIEPNLRSIADTWRP